MTRKRFSRPVLGLVLAAACAVAVGLVVLGAGAFGRYRTSSGLRRSWHDFSSRVVASAHGNVEGVQTGNPPDNPLEHYDDTAASARRFAEHATQASGRASLPEGAELEEIGLPVGEEPDYRRLSFRAAADALSLHADVLANALETGFPGPGAIRSCRECERIMTERFGASPIDLRVERGPALGVVPALSTIAAEQLFSQHSEAETVVDKRYLLSQALEVLELGVAESPDSWRMHFELGWALYDWAHEPWRAAEYFYRADQLPGVPDYVTRMYYRCFEHVLDFEHLMPALEYARQKHTDSDVHQKIVERDLEWWTRHRDDPQEHRRQIVVENTARRQRGVPFYLYPGDPYWDVCPMCGLPSPKGSEECLACSSPLA